MNRKIAIVKYCEYLKRTIVTVAITALAVVLLPKDRLAAQNPGTPIVQKGSVASTVREAVGTTNRRMAKLAAEVGLPTIGDLPWFQPTSFWRPNRLNSQYDSKWRMFSDRVHLAIKNDYLGFENPEAISFERLRGQYKDRERSRKLEKAASRIRLVAPTFAINHLAPKTYNTFFHVKTDKSGQLKLDTRLGGSIDGWRGGSPAERESNQLGFVRQNATKIESLKIELPIRYVVSHRAYVSVYDQQNKRMPITYRFPSGRKISESVPFPGVTQAIGQSGDLKIPVSGFQLPEFWPTDSATASQYSKRDLTNRDGMQTIWMAYTVQIDSVPDRSARSEEQTQLVATIDSAAIYKNENLRDKLHEFKLDRSSIPAQLRPLSSTESTSPILNPSDHLQMASLALHRQPDVFDMTTWASIWYNQQRFDRRRKTEPIGRPPSNDRPFFANQRIDNSRPKNLTQEDIAPLKSYLTQHGKNFNQLEVRCRFQADGFGPRIDLASFSPATFSNDLPKSLAGKVKNYFSLEKSLGQDWKIKNRFSDTISNTIPSRNFLLANLGPEKLVTNFVSDGIQSQIAKKPSDAYCRIEYQLHGEELVAGKNGETYLVLIAAPKLVEVSIFDPEIRVGDGGAWSDRLKIVSVQPVGSRAVKPEGPAAKIPAVEPTTQLAPVTPDAFSLATFPMIAAKYVDGFVKSRSNQLMRSRHEHEQDFRSDPKSNRYGVVQRLGAFFGPQDDLPLTEKQRAPIRNAFETWYQDASNKLSSRFLMKTSNFKFKFDPESKSLSPVLFSDATSPFFIPDGVNRYQSMEETTNDSCISYEEYQKKYPDGLPENEDIRVRDIKRYNEHVAAAPLELGLGSWFSIRDTAGKSEQLGADKPSKRVNKYGIPIEESGQTDRPIHAVLRFDKELRLPDNATIADDDIKLEVGVVFDIKSVSLQKSPPTFHVSKTLSALSGRPVSTDGGYNDRGDYLVIEAQIVQARMIDESTGKVVFELEAKTPETLAPIRPPIPNIFQKKKRIRGIPGLDTPIPKIETEWD